VALPQPRSISTASLLLIACTTSTRIPPNPTHARAHTHTHTHQSKHALSLALALALALAHTHIQMHTHTHTAVRSRTKKAAGRDRRQPFTCPPQSHYNVHSNECDRGGQVPPSINLRPSNTKPTLYHLMSHVPALERTHGRPWQLTHVH